MKTVAEFVESETIEEKLRCLGADNGQGYSIARLRPFADFFRSSTENSAEIIKHISVQEHVNEIIDV